MGPERLTAVDGRLTIAGVDAEDLARAHCTPVFAYDLARYANEAADVFAEDYPMPPVAEGDVVAILNAGGYLQAMSSTHCLRPMAPAVFLTR